MDIRPSSTPFCFQLDFFFPKTVKIAVCIGRNGLFISKLKEAFSFQARAFGMTFESTASILYVAAVAAVCIVLMTVVYNKTYRRK